MLGTKLYEALVSNLSARSAEQAAALPRLPDRLEALHQAASAAWPDVALEPEPFGCWLAARVDQAQDLLGALDALVVVDLYLACACAEGDQAALGAFGTRYRDTVRGALLKEQLPPDMVEEALQQLFEKLFVRPSPEREPRIASYRGTGPLFSWLRIGALRLAYNLLRGEKRRPDKLASGDDALVELAAADSSDPEVAYVKQHYQQEFRRGIEAAIAAIGARDRAVLKLYFADRLTLEEIGGLYDVHTATVSRWLAKARQALLQGVHALLLERLGIDESQYRSILRVLDGDLHLTLSRVLRDGPSDDV